MSTSEFFKSNYLCSGEWEVWDDSELDDESKTNLKIDKDREHKRK